MPEQTAPATATLLEKVMSKYTAEQVEAEADCLPDAYEDQAAKLRDYAALLRERESDVPEGMAATKLKPPLPKSFLGTEDFCFCDNLVSLQGISGNGAPEGYLGNVRLKVNGKFVTYVREHESAKASVTKDVLETAWRVFITMSSHGESGPNALRKALEAVAPMLASARVPDEPTEEMLVAARDWSYRKYGKPIGNDAAIGCWQAMLAAAGEPNHDA